MKVQVETAEIQHASDQLKARGADMEAAIQSAENAIGPLRSMVSPRVERDLAAWDGIKATFLKNLENLVEAAQEIYRAAVDNEAANQ